MAKDLPPARQIFATSPRTVELLAIALAAKPVVPRRVELVRDLGGCAVSASLPHVIVAMTDPDPAVRAQAARSAAVLADPSALQSLRKLFSDADPSVRSQAVRAAAALNDPSLVEAGLQDPDETVFMASCEMASTPEHSARIAARLKTLSVQAKLGAMRALARQHDQSRVPAVAAELNSTELLLLVAAIEALGQMNASAEIQSLQKLLDHPHPTVRRASVIALGELANADSQIASARRMLTDADLSVRAAAAELLAAHPSADTIGSLVEQLGAGYAPLNNAARHALVCAATISSDQVTEAAVRLIADPKPLRREDGSYLLGQIRSDAALDHHIKLLEDSDLAVVRQAAVSLGQIGRPEAGPPLAKLAARVGDGKGIGSAGPSEAQAIGSAFVACGQVGYKPLLPLTAQLIPEKLDCPVVIRARAIWAAGMLGESSDATLAAKLLSVFRDTSPFESEEARFEACKAIGNMRYAPALDSMRLEGQQNPVPSLRWISHCVADRLGGVDTPYTPPSERLIADTSIQDISH